MRHEDVYSRQTARGAVNSIHATGETSGLNAAASCSSIELDDLIQAGMVGLLEA